MEKLFVIYDDCSKLTVTNKRNDTMISYFHRKVGYRPSIKSAVVQRYPKKDNPPIVLIHDGKPVVTIMEDAV